MANDPADMAHPAHQPSTSHAELEAHVGAPKLAGWRALGIAAGSGVALGLIMGILLGRATVAPIENERSEASRPVSTRPRKEKPREAPPVNPPDAYVIDLGRPPQENERVSGFERELLSRRKVARLEGPAGSVQVPFVPTQGKAYALTGIAHLEGTSKATLRLSVGEKPLPEWPLGEGWHFYGSLIAPTLFSNRDQNVGIASMGLEPSDKLHLDSLAFEPVGETVMLTIGAESRGHLVDGFSGPSGRSVWSDGPRSIIGFAVLPAKSPYELTLRASAFHPLAPLSVKLTVNGVVAGTASLSKSVEAVSWMIPQGTLRMGANELVLEPSQTGQPSKFNPSSKDQRHLAIRLFSIALTPQH